MHRLLPALFLLVCAAPAWAVPVGLPAPDFTQQDLEGKEVKLSNLAGRVVILNFWATWGSGCDKEMESLQALTADLPQEGPVALGINRRESAEQAADFAKARKVAYQLILDDGVISKLYDVNGVPDTYIIDRRGIVRRRLQGYNQQFAKELRNTVNTLLKETLPPPAETTDESSPSPTPTSEPRPDKVPAKLRAYAHLQLAAAHINIGDAFVKANLGDDGNYDLAIRELQQGLALDAKSVDLVSWLGVAYERKGNKDRAVEYYRAVLRLDGKNTYAKQALTRLGAPWEEGRGQRAETSGE